MPTEPEPPEQRIRPPRQLSRAEMQQRAEAFLEAHHPSKAPPTPIEEIVEFDLGINIVPIPGLYRDTGLDGFMSSNLAEITIDEDRMLRYAGRYHFTLAHELAHKELHGDLYSQFQFRTLAEWQRFVHAIGESLHERLESEADEFAGLILVPKESLQAQLQTSLKRAQSRGVNISTLSDVLLEYVAEELAQDFDVSSQVVKIRLTREKWFGHRRK